jgi:hypothetical protein
VVLNMPRSVAEAGSRRKPQSAPPVDDATVVDEGAAIERICYARADPALDRTRPDGRDKITC